MNDQTQINPNRILETLEGYTDEPTYDYILSQHTTDEANAIDLALSQIETAMISIFRNAESDSRSHLLEAILAIWDNSRDLAFDEDTD